MKKQQYKIMWIVSSFSFTLLWTIWRLTILSFDLFFFSNHQLCEWSTVMSYYQFLSVLRQFLITIAIFKFSCHFSMRAFWAGTIHLKAKPPQWKPVQKQVKKIRVHIYSTSCDQTQISTFYCFMAKALSEVNIHIVD